MAFVNEFIPASDVVNYGIAAINQYYLRSDFRPHWTVARDRDIYLREVASGREEFAGDYTYTLYWKGDLIRLDLREKSETKPGRAAWRSYALLELDLPAHLEPKRSEILADLKEALIARNGAGVYSLGVSTEASFDF